jgi:hypothetical protein
MEEKKMSFVNNHQQESTGLPISKSKELSIA